MKIFFDKMQWQGNPFHEDLAGREHKKKRPWEASALCINNVLKKKQGHDKMTFGINC